MHWPLKPWYPFGVKTKEEWLEAGGVDMPVPEDHQMSGDEEVAIPEDDEGMETADEDQESLDNEDFLVY